MKDRDFAAGIILFLIGLGACLKSLTYPIGSVSSPGAGIFPILSSIVLMGLSGALIMPSLLKKKNGENPQRSFFNEKVGLRQVLSGILALVIFRYLLPVFGFALSTVVLIFYLTKLLGDYSWKFSFFFSLITAFLAFLLFEIGLKIPMPKGMIGF